MLKGSFKLFVVLEAFFSAVIPLFIVFVIYMYLKDNQLFTSPLYVTAAAVISIAVLFWVYKSIEDLLKIDGE
jgi:hypothetical protein